MDNNKAQEQPSQTGKDGQSQSQNQRTNDPTSLGKNPAEQSPDGDDTNTQAGEWQRPLTNQDEQKKRTNAGDSDSPLGENETEGDPGQERLKPYKNIGDDSEDVEKKTPTM